MKCLAKLDGWYGKDRSPGGGRKVVFAFRDAFHDLPVSLACGKCLACRLKKAREWSVRLLHEAESHDESWFVTLTYAEAPRNSQGFMTLRPRDFVLFMKRLRKVHAGKVRFFQAGEYGSLGRPHHHALMFGLHVPDAEVVHGNDGRRTLYRSAWLEDLWNQGFVSLGEVSVESAAYVARYTTKKIGERRGYEERGELPEYQTMSRRPGIGSAWFKKYGTDVFPDDEVTLVGGRKVKAPRYYLNLLEGLDREAADSVKGKRVAGSIKETMSEGPDSAWKRLTTHQVVERRLNDILKRRMD